MLTNEQIAQFELHGLLQLPQAVPAAKALAMRERLWAFMSVMHGRNQGDPTTWKAIDGRTRFKILTRTGAFDDLRAHLPEPITDLLGPTWNPPEHWGGPLVTFPHPEREWAIPATLWHVDSTAWSIEELLPGLVSFTFLDDVRSRGGGTLVIAGSHRLTWLLCQRAGGFMKTSKIKAKLARDHPWFADLWREDSTDSRQLRRYLDDGAVIDDTHVRVVELCGQPGDVVLMNQRILHVAAPNALDSPRMMLADFITRGPDREP
jgi:Phytanoyl-CoA dioxygenase (PhyH)